MSTSTGGRRGGKVPLVLDVTHAGWAATIGVIVMLFALDLFVSRPGHAHAVGFREAVIASVFSGRAATRVPSERLAHSHGRQGLPRTDDHRPLATPRQQVCD